MKKVIISGNNKDIDSLLKMERLFIKQRGLLVKEEKISKKNTKHSTKEEKPVELTKELKPKLSNKSK